MKPATGWMTQVSAAARLKRSTAWLFSLRKKGEGPEWVKVKGQIFYNRASVEAYKEFLTTAPSPKERAGTRVSHVIPQKGLIDEKLEAHIMGEIDGVRILRDVGPTEKLPLRIPRYWLLGKAMGAGEYVEFDSIKTSAISALRRAIVAAGGKAVQHKHQGKVRVVCTSKKHFLPVKLEQKA